MSSPTWSDYKTYSSLAGTDYDAVGAVLVSTAKDFVAKRMGRNALDAADYTETCDGTGSGSFDVRNWPINTVTSVSLVLDDDTTEAYDATAYRFDSASGRIHRLAGHDAYWFPEDTLGFPRNRFGKNPAWPYRPLCLQVVYNGGYQSAAWSDARKLAIYQLVDMLMNNRRVDELSRVTQSVGALSVQIEQAVQRDERLRFALRVFDRGVAV